MLIVFGGLPGSGKTTLARAFAQQRRATYLRSQPPILPAGDWRRGLPMSCDPGFQIGYWT
jgi:predicted kinase